MHQALDDVQRGTAPQLILQAQVAHRGVRGSRTAILREWHVPVVIGRSTDCLTPSASSHTLVWTVSKHRKPEVTQ